MKTGISSEPIVWGPFSAGGMAAAMLVPVHLLLFGILIPMGIAASPDQASLATLIQHPVGKLYLCVLLPGCFFHWAHRFRYVLVDLGMHGLKTPVAVLCYGFALFASVMGVLEVLQVA